MDDPLILLADDDDDLREALAQGLELAGYRVAAFASAEGVLDQVGPSFNGVLVSDILMAGQDGLALMRAAVEIDPALPVIMITGHGDVPVAVEAMKAGAYDFMEKPFAVSDLAAVVARGLEKRRLVLENRLLREALQPQDNLEEVLVGRAGGMVALRQQIMMLASTNIDVLVFGETGAGKEVVARALHDHGGRAQGPFVALNCGALPAELIESELFGHMPGAFTGASSERVGKLEHANGGTVFLDEIESMPMDLQVKLLRAIETRTIERLGSNDAIPLDIRFIAATKSDLMEESRKGLFREDLYYRLNVATLVIPALRERKEDIPLLFYHLARQARARYRKDIPDIGSEVIARLMHYDWPGNVRELRNVADRFTLGLGLSLPSVHRADEGALAGSPDERTLAERVGAYERSLIAAELEANGGSIKATYESLKLSRKALYEKMKKYQLEKS